MVCAVCGRKLKSVKSRQMGYGPICYRKKFGASIHAGTDNLGISTAPTDKGNIIIPGQMFIEDVLNSDEFNMGLCKG